MKHTASFVLTTTVDPVILEDYFINLRRFDRLDRVKVFVIPDEKTPRSAYERCASFQKKGMSVACPTLEEQDAFLDKVNFPHHLIPRNTDNRRNVGYLMALESQTDFIVSLDDDNVCSQDEDIFVEHAAVCDEEAQHEEVTSSTGWYNILDMLELKGSRPAYPRGFPYYARHRNEAIETCSETARVSINVGLWTTDPDVDSISRLVNPVKSKGFRGSSVVLGKSTWSPVNTQNTSLRREVIASYYFVKMRYPMAGTSIDRYGDIFSGYFSQACAKHLGDAIRVGTPIVDHRRNHHDCLNDAVQEWPCIVLLEDLLPWLTQEAEMKGRTYPEVYTSLSHAIEGAVEGFRGGIWTDATRAYFHQMGYHMRLWARACERLT